MRGVLRTAAVLVLTAGLLAAFLHGTDLGAVGRAIRGADPGLLVCGFGGIVATYALRAWRWQFLLAPLGPTRFANAVRTTVIGFAVSGLLPARPGEVLRPYLLAKAEGLSPTATFATIVVERVLDLLVVVLLLGAALFAWHAPSADATLVHAIRAGGATAGAAAIGGLVVMLVAAGRPTTIERLLLSIEAVVPARVAQAIAKMGRLLTEGFGVLRDPRRLAAAVPLSFAMWLGIAAQTWFVTRAFGIDLSPAGVCVLLAVLVVGVSVPTPGGVGGFHEAYRLAVTGLFGAGDEAAVGAAIVLHALSFLPVTLLGLVFMVQDGLSLGRMRRLAGEAGQKEDSREMPVLRPPR